MMTDLFAFSGIFSAKSYILQLSKKSEYINFDTDLNTTYKTETGSYSNSNVTRTCCYSQHYSNYI